MISNEVASQQADMQQGHPAPANATIGEKTQGQVDTTEAAAVPEFEEGGYGW
jgi:hypothetical protein